MADRHSSSNRIRRPRILIIEDEVLIALMDAEMARDMGYRISGVAHDLAVTRKELAKRNFDAVLLDISLQGRHHPEIADYLLEMNLPFAFVTGYDYLAEPRHENVPVLQKPLSPDQLRVLLEQLVGPVSSSDETARTA